VAKIKKPEKINFSGFLTESILRAAQTFAAVQAFVARAVAHGDVAAGRAGRRVALVLE
jgi:hypothetical protein